MAKRKGVAYIRVSTASDAQLHSYDFQEQYWRQKLGNEPDTEYVTVYADKGISGRSISKRPQFTAMLQDARDHKFDVIYTKSVSRFARNTVELLATVRELRDIGIEVIFEKENIHTFEPTSEVFLTLAATIAENDLQVDSERMRWSIQHRIENGWIFIGSSIYGYRMTKDNELLIVPDEAEIVKEMYARCIAGEGCPTIAKTLNERGIRTRRGNEWDSRGIREILHNEKYKGDAMMGKQKVIDGYQKRNRNGEYGKKYYIEDSHEPIVSKEIWQQAQDAMESRRGKKTQAEIAPVYPFTGMIYCAKCGERYNHKINNSGLKWASPIWVCSRRLSHNKSACDNTILKDRVLREKFVECYNAFVKERPLGMTAASIQQNVEKLEQEERDLAALARQHLMTDSAFRNEQQRIKAQIRELMDKLADLRNRGVRESDHTPIAGFDETKVKKFITKVVVSDGTVTFVFYNGAEYTRAYSNGQPGNKPGWNKKEEA